MTFKPDRALVLELAAPLQFLKPDEEAMTLWLNILAAGDYAFGYGLLRSDADAYDPFGILVELNGGEWTWDEQDEAWAFAGSATTLNPRTLAGWLGMRVEWDWLNAFMDSVTSLTDRSDSYTPVAATLREAMETAQTARTRLDDAHVMAQSRSSLLQDGPDSEFIQRTVKRYDKAFYGR